METSPVTPDVCVAATQHRAFIRHLQQRFTNSIGFVPDEATERELARGRILLGTLNDDEAGFLLFQPALSTQQTTAAIIQAAVRMDAQRQEVGLALVERLAADAAATGAEVLQAWCRADLESNHFWKAAGFQAIATRDGGKSRGEAHILWRRPLIEAARLNILPVERFYRGPGGRFSRADKATPPKLLLPADVLPIGP